MMTVNQVLDYNSMIKAIIDNAKDVDAKTRFKFLGMVNQFKPIVDNFETIRQEKIAEYGTTNKDGQTGIFEPVRDDFETDSDFVDAQKKYDETIAKFANELQEVLDSEVDVNIAKFKADDIMDSGLNSDYLLALYDLIEE